MSVTCWVIWIWLRCFGGFPGGSDGEESACYYRRCMFDPWVRKIPWRSKWQPTPGFLPGKSQGHRSLAGSCVHEVTKELGHDLVTEQRQDALTPPLRFASWVEAVSHELDSHTCHLFLSGPWFTTDGYQFTTSTSCILSGSQGLQHKPHTYQWHKSRLCAPESRCSRDPDLQKQSWAAEPASPAVNTNNSLPRAPAAQLEFCFHGKKEQAGKSAQGLNQLWPQRTPDAGTFLTMMHLHDGEGSLENKSCDLHKR